MQVKKQAGVEQSNTDTDKIRDAFESLKSKPIEKVTEPKKKKTLTSLLKKKKKVQPATRFVNLKYNSCCGCGCHTYTYKREVPYDSDLRNGDRIDSIEDTDELVD